MISKTNPVSTATVEISFSAMNRIFCWARSSLDSTRASDLMTISLNRDIVKAYNLDSVLERWMMQKKASDSMLANTSHPCRISKKIFFLVY